MGRDVPEALDSAPSNVGVALLDIVREFSRGLCKRFKTPKHRILSVDAPKKCVPSKASSALDAFDSIADVCQMPEVAATLHNGTASRRMASLHCDCDPRRNSTTST